MLASHIAWARRSRSEDGLSLVEVMVAISVIAIVATASASLALNGLAAAASQERRQVAVTIASSGIEIVNAHVVSTLFAGRASTDVATAWSTNSTAAGVAKTYPMWDSTVSTSTGAAIPITSSTTQAGTAYTVTTLLGSCYLNTATVTGDCGLISGYSSAPASTPSGYTDVYRAIVVVKWTAGPGCASGCSYVATTLIDPSTDLSWVSHG